mmetsp:Transcript_38008/g.55745  ORF Transcript_38008/g.55745 Transcript_38008/m.55745 type:complete len:273 (-) Transcript_38008:1759-2577(-)
MATITLLRSACRRSGSTPRAAATTTTVRASIMPWRRARVSTHAAAAMTIRDHSSSSSKTTVHENQYFREKYYSASLALRPVWGRQRFMRGMEFSSAASVDDSNDKDKEGREGDSGAINKEENDNNDKEDNRENDEKEGKKDNNKGNDDDDGPGWSWKVKLGVFLLVFGGPPSFFISSLRSDAELMLEMDAQYPEVMALVRQYSPVSVDVAVDQFMDDPANGDSDADEELNGIGWCENVGGLSITMSDGRLVHLSCMSGEATRADIQQLAVEG